MLEPASLKTNGEAGPDLRARVGWFRAGVVNSALISEQATRALSIENG